MVQRASTDIAALTTGERGVLLAVLLALLQAVEEERTMLRGFAATRDCLWRGERMEEQVAGLVMKSASSGSGGGRRLAGRRVVHH